MTRSKSRTESAKDDAEYLIHLLYFGEPGGARTRDHRIKSAMLYQLSYRPWREENAKLLQR